MLNDILANVLLSGVGGSLLVLLLARLMPDAKLQALGTSLGAKLSALGRHKLGKPFYEAVENFAQHSLGVFLQGVSTGLDKDDNQKT